MISESVELDAFRFQPVRDAQVGWKPPHSFTLKPGAVFRLQREDRPARASVDNSRAVIVEFVARAAEFGVILQGEVAQIDDRRVPDDDFGAICLEGDPVISVREVRRGGEEHGDSVLLSIRENEERDVLLDSFGTQTSCVDAAGEISRDREAEGHRPLRIRNVVVVEMNGVVLIGHESEVVDQAGIRDTGHRPGGSVEARPVEGIGRLVEDDVEKQPVLAGAAPEVPGSNRLKSPGGFGSVFDTDVADLSVEDVRGHPSAVLVNGGSSDSEGGSTVAGAIVDARLSGLRQKMQGMGRVPIHEAGSRRAGEPDRFGAAIEHNVQVVPLVRLELLFESEPTHAPALIPDESGYAVFEDESVSGFEPIVPVPENRLHGAA